MIECLVSKKRDRTRFGWKYCRPSQKTYFDYNNDVLLNSKYKEGSLPYCR